MIDLGSFSSSYYTNGTYLTYNTNSSPCSGNVFRSFDIRLVCSAGPLVISGVSEDLKCRYGVPMSGLAACGNQTQIPNPTQTQTPTPTQTSTPTQICKSNCGGSNNGYCSSSGCVCYPPWVGIDCLSKVIIVLPPLVNNSDPTVEIPVGSSGEGNTSSQPKITCELSNNELTINSTSLIKCVGVGNTFCNIGSDVTCSTDSINGSITCTKSATIYSPSSISCIGNNIKCSSLYVECSIGKQSPNLLVNGVVVKSNVYDSTNTSSNSPTTQTPNENDQSSNDQSSNSSSTLLIFKNIVILILIISITMLFL